MSPVEKIRQITDTTRVSLPVTLLIAVVGATAGVVGAGYAARDQAVAQIRTAIDESVVKEREESDARYMPRAEFAEKVLVPLAEIRTEVKQWNERLERR
ncbi:MAG: hypothetical protein ACO1SX_27155 [Actinomycetota bacterium]